VTDPLDKKLQPFDITTIEQRFLYPGTQTKYLNPVADSIRETEEYKTLRLCTNNLKGTSVFSIQGAKL